MDLNRWVRLPAYQAVVLARLQGATETERAIVAEELDRAQGADRAFWLLVRAHSRITAQVYWADRMWEDIEEAVRLAPQHLGILESAFWTAIGLSVVTERLERLCRFLRGRLHQYRQVRGASVTRLNIGLLHMRRGRWRPAYLAFADGLRAIANWSGERFAAAQRHLTALHMHQARAAVRLGRLETCETHISEAAVLATMLPPGDEIQLILGLARAELAYARGQNAAARRELQRGFGVAPQNPDHQAMAHYQVQSLLLAALIARSEGNQEAVAYFGARAGEIAGQAGLPLTAERVAAVMAGSDW